MDHGDAFSLDTLCIHAGQTPDPTSGAVMTPIVLASTFAQDGPGVHQGYDYSRAGNPTRTALEGCLAALEGAKHAIAYPVHRRRLRHRGDDVHPRSCRARELF